MDDKEKIFALIAASQENQKTMTALLAQLDVRAKAFLNAEETLIQAVRGTIGVAVTKSLSDEKKTLGEAVINAKKTFRDLRPASFWNYFWVALIGAMFGTVVTTGLFYGFIKDGGIGQPPIHLDTEAVAKSILAHLPKRSGMK